MRFSTVLLAGTAALTNAAAVPQPPQHSSLPIVGFHPPYEKKFSFSPVIQPVTGLEVLHAAPVKVGLNRNVDVDTNAKAGLDADTDADIDADADTHLEKRGAGARLNGAADGIGAGASIAEAMSGLLQKLFPINNWTSARETFTKATVDAMWARNPDRRRWVAAACYNMNWDVANRGGISDVASVKLSMGALNTDYDCFYIGRNNALWTRGDGGYINLAIVSDSNFCTFDGRTADLTCR
ncbi:hypothetical protein J3E72DRAFT_270955 [Bipolaris maydis]|nr:hypothetical protein BM1_07311 [Bipolaris maydis]KAJ5023442.1 hypothetical protein J3E73DRAFT_372617 [Bipolaris maydis]KAJ6195868.1 hypothetical protein J3E72DRAFT_270955 [Bipolaris maydis]KAJ6269350.1 hypothetical protein PSV08DRAFT_353769 [Bipolaris maydis]KAJ6280164.1 hypothetical protein J3E71DRAFT_344826 [Bipolaris maydis]